MRTTHIYHAVDSHTEGMPTRVITGGVPPIPGTTMAERRLWFAEHRDGDRKSTRLNASHMPKSRMPSSA